MHSQALHKWFERKRSTALPGKFMAKSAPNKPRPEVRAKRTQALIRVTIDWIEIASCLNLARFERLHAERNHALIALSGRLAHPKKSEGAGNEMVG